MADPDSNLGEVDGPSNASNIRVMVRFRPETSTEQKSNDSREFIVRFSEDETGLQLKQMGTDGRPITERNYTFDKVFGPMSTQDYVFEKLARSTVDDVVRGFNGTVFAYGQTGSGKSFSMFGGPTYETRGIIPRSAEYLFDELQRNEEIKQVTIKCSFLEIYKERVRDLLNANNKEPLKIRETPRGAVRVMGLSEEYVSSPDDVIDLIEAGMKNRAVAHTDMNELSSRSHAVLTITVTQKLQDGSIRVGKLNMADLAGSERADKSGLTGSTLQEAKKINQSLSALGNCINALTDNKRSHTPFRDSKLTYFLKDSLGGNTKTTLLVCCSPHVSNSDETLSTLLFGQRAAHVRNQVRVNKQLSVNELQSLVNKLKKQLAASRARIRALQAGRTDLPPEDFGDDDYVDDLPPQRPDPARSRTLPGGAAQAFRGAVSPTAAPMDPRQYGTMPAGAYDEAAALESTLEALSAYQLDFPDFGPTADDGFSQHDSIIAQNSLALQQRMTLRNRAQGVDAPVMFAENKNDEPSADGSGDDPAGGVVARAKNAIRRSLASRSSSEPLEEPQFLPATERDVSGSSAGGGVETVAEEEESEHELAKQKLQEELSAAQQRRNLIREAHKKRAEMLAKDRYSDEKFPMEEDAFFDNEDPQQPRPPLAPADKANAEAEIANVAAWHRKGNSGPQVAHPLRKADDTPPPPADGAQPSPTGDPAAPGGRRRNSLSGNLDGTHKLTRVRGPVEFRIDLVPDPDVYPTGEAESLGFVECATDDMKLEDLRAKIMKELDNVPKDFIFTRKNVPIGKRQEKKRTVAYIATAQDVVQVRVDLTGLGGDDDM